MGDTIKFKRGREADLPSRAEVGEPLWTTDTETLYIGRGKDKRPVPIKGFGGGGSISVSTGLQLSHDRPEGARAWIVPTFENSDEFNYIDEWVQNKKFIADNDRAIWVASDNEGTSVNENKMMLKNVKTLTITNNTGTDLAYFCYFKKLDGILAYQGSSVKANSTATVYCTNKDEQIYENVKLYIKGLISTGDISVVANY